MRVIVIGGGEVGFTIARHLAEEKIDVVMIEQDEARSQKARDELDISVLTGHGASPRLLTEAGIDDATIFVSVTNSDETNLVACAIAAALNPSVERLARLRNEEYIAHLEKTGAGRLGVDLVINLDVEAARGVMDLLDAPTADAVRYFADRKVRLTGFRVQPGAPIMNRTLSSLAQDFDLRRALIVAIDRGTHVVIPRGDDAIREGDFIWLIVDDENMEKMTQLVGKAFSRLRRVMIVGGTSVGYHLAKMLETRDIPCKLIEEDRATAETLAQELSRTMVIHGHGIDIALLREENVEDSSAFIAATPQDEDNILAAMIASREGVPRVIALIERRGYASVVGSIGITALVSKNVAAVNTVLGMVRKGKILGAAVLGPDAEVLEFLAMETAPVTMARIRDLEFPKGAILGALVREGEVIIPSGEDQVRPGDQLLVFTTKKAMKKVEKLFAVGVAFF